jgi:hypothetical protein
MAVLLDKSIKMSSTSQVEPHLAIICIFMSWKSTRGFQFGFTLALCQYSWCFASFQCVPYQEYIHNKFEPMIYPPILVDKNIPHVKHRSLLDAKECKEN